MFKKRNGFIRLRIQPKKATPTPPISSSLGQKGLNIIDFCKKFNEKTNDIDNSFMTVSVLISYYSDKSYDFFIKRPSISIYLKKKIFKIENFNFEKNFFINFYDILEICKYKIIDFNCLNFYSSIKIVLGFIKTIKFVNVIF